MTLVNHWLGFGDAFPSIGETGSFAVNPAVIEGSTLLRTIGTIELNERYDTATFPPDEPLGVWAGVYQAVNTDDPAGVREASNPDGEWLWHKQIPLFSGFGLVTAVEQQLLYAGYADFDVKGRRLALVDNPCLKISFAGFGNLGDTSWDRGYRQLSGKFSIRQLWAIPE